MSGKQYKSYEEFLEAFENTPEEILQSETYSLLKLYNKVQTENTKLKQDKQELIKKLKEEIEDNMDYYDEEDKGSIDKPTLFKILEKLG